MEVLQDTYKDTKIGRIPKDWEILRLGEVCLKIRDGNYGGSYPKANEFLNSGVPFLTSASIGGGNFIIKKKIKFISPEKHSELTKAHIKFGDVLFTNRGANVGSVALVKQELDDANIGPQLTYLRCKLDVIDNQYLFNLMQSNSFQKQVKSLDNGTAMNFFGIGTTKTFKLPIPTLPEQQKIAAILSTVDEQISTTDKIIEKSKELKKGLMQKLFSEGIGHTEFKDTKIGRIPKDWDVMMLNEIGVIKVGRDLNKEIYSSKFNKEYRVPVYSNAITDRGSYGFYSRSEYPPKSITITGRGYIGYAFQRDEEFGAIGRLIVIQPNSNVDYIYLTNYINHSVNFHIETSGIPQLTGVQASKYKVAIPPLNEQQKIATILSEADAKIEKEQEQKAQLEALKKGLMQQLLTGKKRVKV